MPIHILRIIPYKMLTGAGKDGAAYAMLEAFAVPIGFHGSEEQTGSVLHYEFNETLFMFNPFSKHSKGASQAEGMPILYPDTPIGAKAFPWRFGSENIETGSNDWHQEDLATDRKWNGWTQDWDSFLTRDFNPSSQTSMEAHPLGITCSTIGEPSYPLRLEICVFQIP